MFSFSNKDIIASLKDRIKKTDVHVRILLRDTKPNREAASELEGLNTDKIVIEYSKKYLHRKLAVFDKEYVWIGSTNWSEKGLESNEEVDVSINDLDLAKEITDQFETDWMYPDGKPEEPSQDVVGNFIGNRKTKVYHLPTCSYAIHMDNKNKVPFDTAQDAESKGYRPCEKCKPH